jgi:hypothetical protein
MMPYANSIRAGESGVVTAAGSCGALLTYERSMKTEMWTGLEGGIELSRLTDSPLFPLEPDLTSYNNSDFYFEVPPAQAADNFGYRLTGYFRAPETGNYTFFVACAGQARLSLDGQAIARVDADGNGLPYANLGRIYDQYPEQTSRPRSLVEGKFYLIEALGKVGALSDLRLGALIELSRLSVGVAMPNGVESKVSKGNCVTSNSVPPNPPPLLSPRAADRHPHVHLPAQYLRRWARCL